MSMKTTRFRRSTTLRAYSTGAVPHIILDQASQVQNLSNSWFSKDQALRSEAYNERGAGHLGGFKEIFCRGGVELC
eukprot:766636-Amorphochlora_amoeboformis.AAC.1